MVVLTLAHRSGCTLLQCPLGRKALQLHWVRSEGASQSTQTKLHRGAVYFTAHPVDGLLFQNPNLLHDLYVWKCVTTVVMTSGDRGMDSKFSQSLERGLQHSYALMADLTVDNATMENTTVARVGTHDLHSWSLNGMPSIQLIYLRLPDGAPHGHGYDAYKGESLGRLYKKEIDNITSTDGNATYTLKDLKEIIGFILYERKPSVIHLMNHKVSHPGDQQFPYSSQADHSDHLVSAKLVQNVINVEKINATVKSQVQLQA
jgi:hypothetical protein